MSDSTYTLNDGYTQYKAYPAFDYIVPFDLLSNIPNYYFKIYKPDNTTSWSINLQSDDFYAKIGSFGDKTFHIWLPADQAYKDFDYFLVVNGDKTKPTYITTLDSRPQLKISEDSDYIYVQFILRHKLMQHIIIDKSKMNVIYLKNLNTGVENAS